MKNWVQLWKAFWSNESGASSIEYFLILAALLAALAIGVSSLGEFW